MKPYHHFKREERFVLTAYLQEGFSFRYVAKKLGRRVSAISYEVKRNSRDGTRESYGAEYADLVATWRKYDANCHNPLKKPEVWRYVTAKLKEDWSPEEISNRLKLEYPNNPKIRVSHETIYQFVNSTKGKQFLKHLRRGKARRQRRKYRLQGSKPKIINRISIQTRPKRVDSRRRYGDWESDTLIGKRERAAVVSAQLERRSRFLKLTKVLDKSAPETRQAIQSCFSQFPKSLRRTLTVDNGTENAEHEQFGMPTYFCDSYCSWQKGSVENSLGLVRQYLPKSSNFNELTPADLKLIESRLNNRPRKCLGWRTPIEVLSTHLKRLGVQLPA